MKKIIEFIISNWGEISAVFLAFLMRLIEKRRDKLKIARDMEKMISEKNGLMANADIWQFINKLKGRIK
jgi:hypothetical protein